MTEKLRADVRTTPILFGREIYTVFVDVTNLSDKLIDEISITKTLVPGLIFEPNQQPENVELTQLESKKRKITREMEAQVGLAYERKVLSELSTLERYIAWTSKILSKLLPVLPLPAVGEVAGVATKELSVLSVPAWAKEALHIENWEDIERLEQEIIQNEAEESFLRKAYSLNKAKLRKILDEIEETQSKAVPVDLKDTYSIQPGETISFHFRGRVPFVYRIRDYPIQFNISYRDQKLNTIGSFSVSENITFNPSPVAIGLGAFVGAITGFVIRRSLIIQQDWFSQSFWLNFLGSVLLAVVITFLTVRTADSKKPITVEDFVGGLIVGAVTVLFFESILDKLRAFIQAV